MKICIFNGFPFHYEMFGYIIEYCEQKGISLDIYTEFENNVGWLRWYEKKYSNTITIYEHTKIDKAKYDYFFLTTDDDYKLKLNHSKNKVVCINHYYLMRRPEFEFHVGVRQFNDRLDLPFAMPCFNVINANEKRKLLQNETKINIVLLGRHNLPQNKTILESIFNNTSSIKFYVINRFVGYELLQNEDLDIVYYQNCSAFELINILCKSHYVLNLSNHIPHMDKSMSGSIPLSFSCLCQLIIPTSWNEFYKFKTAITYDLSEQIILSSLIDGNTIQEEREAFISKRNNVFDNIIEKQQLRLMGGFNSIIQKIMEFF